MRTFSCVLICISFVFGGVLSGCAIEPNPSPLQENESSPSIEPPSDDDGSNIPLGGGDGGDGVGTDESAENGGSTGDEGMPEDEDVIEPPPDVSSPDDDASTQDSSKSANSD